MVPMCKLNRTIAHCGKNLLFGHEKNVEKLWREFFTDPSQWWDNRSEKVNARYPDFKHKKTQVSLWLNSKLKPPWVEAELAAMVPPTVQLDLSTWNKKLARYVKDGRYEETIEFYQQMQQEDLSPDKFTFIRVLNACASLRAVEEGRRIHQQIDKSDCKTDIFVGSCLVDMYAKCGSIEDAWKVFNTMSTRDVVCWGAMIQGFVKCGQGQKALELSREMEMEGVQPNRFTFVGLLNACARLLALDEGRRVHEHIIRNGCEYDVFVGSSLVDMYVKCGSIEDAWTVFKKMPTRDIVVWSVMILGFVKCGEGHKALRLFRQMRCYGFRPIPATFVGLLNACASVAALEEGRCVHEQIIRSGCESDLFVGSSLVDMYAKCGSIDDAWRVFKKMPTCDVVAWNVMIQGFVKCGEGKNGLELFRQMLAEGVEPDLVTFLGLLNACANIGDLKEGRGIHEQIIKRGYDTDIFVGTSLVDMYAKCGSTEDACEVFDKMQTNNVVCWNAMILGYAKSGEGHKALELSQEMHGKGIEPNSVTFLALLNACASITALEEGRNLHQQIIQNGCESHIMVGNCLVDMYAKCGSIDDAQRMFDKISSSDVVTWNALLGGYAMHGHAMEALGHFERMVGEGVQIDGVSLVSLLSACSHAGLVDEGLHFFESMSAIYDLYAAVEHYACIIDLLGRAGRLHEAEDVTKMMSCEPNATLWTSLLGACKAHGNVEVGGRVARRVLELEPKNSSAAMLLSNTYSASGE